MNDTAAGLLQLGFLVLLLAATCIPLSSILTAAATSEKHWRVERWTYKAIGVNPDRSQNWKRYLTSVMLFSMVGLLLLYALLRLQRFLPFNGGHAGMEAATAFNTTLSFVGNTNWQSYAGESTLGGLAQMVGLAVQNFASPAVGLAVAFALMRALAAQNSASIGNFFIDLVRGSYRILLPLAFLVAVVFMISGIPQLFHSVVEVTGVNGATQSVPVGPVATQEAIKLLGTNGGGFFNANSAHPFENPNGLTNVLQVWAILVIPFALPLTFGQIVKDRRQGLTVLAVMVVLQGLCLAAITIAENTLSGTAVAAAGGAMEGKEQRFGIWGSALFASATTGTSTGAVNSMHDSYTAVGGGVAMLQMMLGEVSPGGVGSGLYGMLMIAILSVFIAGLMVGRTPEYLGKRIGSKEMTLVSLSILCTPFALLVGTAIAMATQTGRDALANSGPHGLSEMLYAFTSAANNNGSAFGGLDATSTLLNVGLGLAIFIGRFGPILMIVALAGLFAQQRTVPVSAGTLPTHGPLFGGLMVGVVILVGALCYLPALALGPIAEALL